jgi:salicylate hydroxylase
MLQYGDLYSMLYNLAVSAGVTITFNMEIVSLSVDRLNGTPQAVLADGTVLMADLVIGADGSEGVARKSITGPVEGDISSDHSFLT